jgi:hypothetical protein
MSDEDIENKRVSGNTAVCYFTLNLLNSFLSRTDDNTTRARDHPVMMSAQFAVSIICFFEYMHQPFPSTG